MPLPHSSILNNLYVARRSQPDNSFERHYIHARNKEKRICNDLELHQLPDISPFHPHFEEWKIRKRSAARLIRFLNNKKKPLNILEIGCGNGWLSYQLSTIANSQVVGQDINFTELQQAARVFNANKRLRFVYGDIFNGVLRGKKFDVIVFAASIQYFPSFNQVIAFAMDQLNPGGEIHIIDTHFYEPTEIESAKNRTVQYYRELGSPEMACHYYHHSTQSLKNFRHRLLFDPRPWYSKLFHKNDPFLWICINNG